jgi:hypothetical protein
MIKCQPCITIRQIAKIIWYNLLDCIDNTRKDIRSYSRVNQTVCRLDTGNYGPIPAEALKSAIKRQSKQDNVSAVDWK